MLPGYVLPCCAVMMSNNRRWLRRCSFGNLFRDGFVDVWNDVKYSRFRELLLKKDAPLPEICFGCRAMQTFDRAREFGIWSMQEDSKDLYDETSYVPISFPDSKDVPILLDDVDWVFVPLGRRIMESIFHYYVNWRHLPSWCLTRFKRVVRK